VTVQVRFKFRNTASPRRRTEVLKQLQREGAARVRKLFPRETDPELASLHVADASGEAAGNRILKTLKSTEGIEFAEGPTPRRLIR